jgi:hypothetical protein
MIVCKGDYLSYLPMHEESLQAIKVQLKCTLNFRTYAVSERIPKIRGECALAPYFRILLIHLRQS